MTNNDEQEIVEYKKYWAGVFGRAAPTYDQVGPKFFVYFGRRLVEQAQLFKGARVLDVATGRGAVLFPAVETVGQHGFVVGIDIAEAMVQEIAMEINSRGLKNAEVKLMDAEYLQFPDASFDYVLCGLSIFIFPQHEKALSEIYRVLKPGGVIGLTTFWRDDERWKWLGELFKKHIPKAPEPETVSEPEGIDEDEEELPEPDFRSPEGMEAVMKTAGFINIQIEGEEPDFVYTNEEDWWDTVWSHGMRGTLEKIELKAGTDTLKKFKSDAFKSLQTNKQPDGFHQMWSVLYTTANKPQD